jgi:hypothetical protein
MTTFGKALSEIISGVSRIESLSEALVSAAIHDICQRISRDYGIEYKQLVTRYLADVVHAHSSAAISAEDAQCRAMARNGKQCARRSVLGGYCLCHATSGIAEDAKRRRIVTHAHAIAEIRRDPVTTMMSQLRTTSDAAYNIPKSRDPCDDLV